MKGRNLGFDRLKKPRVASITLRVRNQMRRRKSSHARDDEGESMNGFSKWKAPLAPPPVLAIGRISFQLSAALSAVLFFAGCNFVSDLRDVARQMKQAQPRHAKSVVLDLRTRFSAVVPQLDGAMSPKPMAGTLHPAKVLVLQRAHFRLKNVFTGYAVEEARSPWEVSELTLDLPDSLRATDPANVEVIALVESRARHLGNYGQTSHAAYILDTSVSLLQTASHTVFSIGTISGSPPMANISGGSSVGSDAVIGVGPSDQSVVDLIVSRFSS
jgi:hypothetical protein